MSIGQNRVSTYSRTKYEENNLENQFKISINAQCMYFTSLSQSCEILEQNLQKLEKKISIIIEKQNMRLEDNEESLQALKIKQFQFIIKELQQRIAKQSKSENITKVELVQQKNQNQELKQKLSRLQNAFKANQQKVQVLRKREADKSEQLEELRRKNQEILLKLEKITKRPPLPQQKKEISLNDYEILESKLYDLEKQYKFQMESQKQKNKIIKIDLAKTQQLYQEEKIKCDQISKEKDSLKMNKFQLQIRLKQQSQAKSQLQDSYSKLLQKSNSSELRLHQQIHQLKTLSIQDKTAIKQQKKQYRQHLIDLINWLNSKTGYVFSGSTTKQYFQETKKVIEKVMARKCTAFVQEIQMMKTDLISMKQKIEEKDQTIFSLEQKTTSFSSEDREKGITKDKEKEKQKEKEKDKDKDRSSENGSFINNRSSEKPENENAQKMKQKFELLRKELKQKQSIINDLEANQHLEFEKSKANLISLETMLSDKNNECRKYELILKDKNSQIAELTKTITENLTLSSSQIRKLESEKQASIHSSDKRYQQTQAKIKTLKISYRQLEKKQQQKTIKYNKLKAKYEKYQVEFSETLKRKNLQNEALMKQNSKLKIENKILSEKIQLNEIIIPPQMSPTQTPVNKDLIEQIELQRDRILEQYQIRNQEYINLNQQHTSLRMQVNSLKKLVEDQQMSNAKLNNQKSALLQELEKLSKKKEAEAQQKQQENHSLMKKELQKLNEKYNQSKESFKKMQIDHQELKSNIEKVNKQSSQKDFQIQKLKSEIVKKSDECKQISENMAKMKEDFIQKLSSCAVKQQQLIDIINYKNRQVNNQLRQSMKGQQLFFQIHNMAVNTDLLQKMDKETNTDPPVEDDNKFILRENDKGGIIANYLLAENGLQQIQEQIQEQLGQFSKPLIKEQQSAPQSNLFIDLQNKNEDNNFQIFDEGEEINIGQASLNFQIKELFNKLRLQIQKLFNEEDISFSIMKILPKHLEDDYQEFIAYIREKITDLKQENNLSFIMADAGEERVIEEDIGVQIHQFLLKSSNEEAKLKKIIYQKEEIINGLINQKTEQQHTINQLTLEKEEIQEQNQNRFMNQCTVYKKEIKEHKKYIDALEMDFQSMKNIFKNVFQIWIDQLENQEDLKDNLTLYSKIAKLSEVERSRMNLYIQRYKQVKGFQQE